MLRVRCWGADVRVFFTTDSAFLSSDRWTSHAALQRPPSGMSANRRFKSRRTPAQARRDEREGEREERRPPPRRGRRPRMRRAAAGVPRKTLRPPPPRLPQHAARGGFRPSGSRPRARPGQAALSAADVAWGDAWPHARRCARRTPLEPALPPGPCLLVNEADSAAETRAAQAPCLKDSSLSHYSSGILEMGFLRRRLSRGLLFVEASSSLQMQPHSEPLVLASACKHVEVALAV